ncbi:SDR family oxidoreductase [Sphingomonas sp. YL-JM2C]
MIGIARGEDRVALVTGGGSGLGAHIVCALHADGYRVLIGDVAMDGAKALARDLDAGGERVRAVPLDVRDKRAFVAAVEAAADWGGIDVLVNNAAITPTTPVMLIEPDEFDAVMAVNLRGPFFGCQVVGEHLRGRRAGRIINIASQAGQMGGTVTGAHYAAAKAALMLLTKFFAREFGGTGITVNAVSPGALDLPAVRAALPAERLQAIAAAMPSGRLGHPEEVAAAVCLLASSSMGYVTGATWDINGGTFMR